MLPHSLLLKVGNVSKISKWLMNAASLCIIEVS